MRGLTLFITDIRKCRCKEDEIKRINKELANIRSKFKGDKPLNGYHKKKYVCKLLFMFLLGHKCDFGHVESLNLLSSNAYSEKQIGYLFISIIKGNHDFMPLIINSLKSDLSSHNKYFQNLALQFVSNYPNTFITESVGNQVIEILISGGTDDFVKQTCALTLLQLLRTKPDIVSSEHVMKRIINLLSHHDLGVVTSSASLIEHLIDYFPSQCEFCVTEAVCRLSRITAAASYLDFNDYTYYYVSAPWLTVKLLRLLQKFSVPATIAVRARLKESLEIILNKAQEPLRSKKFEHCNARYAIVFEGISTIIQMNVDSSLLLRAVVILGHALKQKEPNLRFMSLDLMSQLSNTENIKQNVKSYWENVLNVAKNDTDIAIKKCAINFLYNLCDNTNAKPIVEEMLYFLATENIANQEEVVLKSAALAELFSTDLEWYIDTTLKIMQICPDYLHDNIYYSLIAVVTDNDSVHEYAASAVFDAVKRKSCPDCIVKTAAYILGEFGYLLEKDPQKCHLKQLNILQEKHASCSFSTQALLLTTYMKFFNFFPDLKGQIQTILRDKCNIRSENEEVQQRAVEYLRLSQIASKSLLAIIFQEMPSCKRKESTILDALEKMMSQTVDGNFTKTLKLKTAAQFRSMCSLANIDQYLKEEKVQYNKFTSHSNLHSDGIYSKQDLLVDLRCETSVASYKNNLSTLPISLPSSNSIAPSVAATTPSLHNLPNVSSPSSTPFKCVPSTLLASTSNAFTIASSSAKTLNFSFCSSKISPIQPPRLVPAPSNEKYIYSMLFSETGVLFEDKVIKVSIKDEFQRNYGRFHLTYENKSAETLSDFTIQGNFANTQNKCSIWFKPSCTVLKSYETMEQDIHIECLNEFHARPSLILIFKHIEHRREIKLMLPLTMNKFVEPAAMSPTFFVQKWQSLGQEIMRTFVAKYSMIQTVTRMKLKGFRVALIENVEVSTENIYCAGIFYKRMQKVGFLVRLERYPEANKYCLVVRSSQRSVAQNISNLLFELL